MLGELSFNFNVSRFIGGAKTLASDPASDLGDTPWDEPSYLSGGRRAAGLDTVEEAEEVIKAVRRRQARTEAAREGGGGDGGAGGAGGGGAPLSPDDVDDGSPDAWRRWRELTAPRLSTAQRRRRARYFGDGTTVSGVNVQEIVRQQLEREEAEAAAAEAEAQASTKAADLAVRVLRDLAPRKLREIEHKKAAGTFAVDFDSPADAINGTQAVGPGGGAAEAPAVHATRRSSRASVLQLEAALSPASSSTVTLPSVASPITRGAGGGTAEPASSPTSSAGSPMAKANATRGRRRSLGFRSPGARRRSVEPQFSDVLLPKLSPAANRRRASRRQTTGFVPTFTASGQLRGGKAGATRFASMRVARARRRSVGNGSLRRAAAARIVAAELGEQELVDERVASPGASSRGSAATPSSIATSRLWTPEASTGTGASSESDSESDGSAETKYSDDERYLRRLGTPAHLRAPISRVERAMWTPELPDNDTDAEAMSTETPTPRPRRRKKSKSRKNDPAVTKASSAKDVATALFSPLPTASIASTDPADRPPSVVGRRQQYYGRWKARRDDKALEGAATDGAEPAAAADAAAYDPVLSKIDEIGALPEPFGITQHKDELRLNSYGLGDERAIALAAVGDDAQRKRFEGNVTVTLGDNRLTDRGMVPLLNQLTASGTQLRFLDLCNNRITAKSATTLGAMLKSTPYLEHLNLEGNAIGDKGVTALCRALCDHRLEFLSRLVVRGCGIGATGAKSLARVLVFQQTGISGFARKRGAVTSRRRGGLKTNLRTGMNVVKFAGKLVAQRRISMGGALPKPFDADQGLKEVDVSWNNLGDDALVSLFEAVRVSVRLAALDLSHSRLGQRSAATAAAAGATEAELPPTRGVRALAKCVGENTSLTHLDISYNCLSEHDVGPLSEGFNRNRTIRGLHVAGNGVVVDARGFIQPRTSGHRKGAAEMPQAVRYVSRPRAGSNAGLPQSPVAAKHSGSFASTPAAARGKGARAPPAAVVAVPATEFSNHDPLEAEVDVSLAAGHDARRIIPATVAVDTSTYLRRELALAQGRSVDAAVVSETDNCWICGGWKPFAFTWRPGISGPAATTVSFVSSLDRWQLPGDAMEQQGDNRFECVRMVPPRLFHFLFRVDNRLRVAQDERYERRVEVTPEGDVSRDPASDPSASLADKFRGVVKAAMQVTRDEDGFISAGGMYVNYIDPAAEGLAEGPRGAPPSRPPSGGAASTASSLSSAASARALVPVASARSVRSVASDAQSEQRDEDAATPLRSFEGANGAPLTKKQSSSRDMLRKALHAKTGTRRTTSVRRLGLVTLTVNRIRPPEVLPRTRPYMPPEQEKSWTKADSVFATYVGLSAWLATKCFEVDWPRTSVPRIIKQEEELRLAKMAASYHYETVSAPASAAAAAGARSRANARLSTDHERVQVHLRHQPREHRHLVLFHRVG